LKLQIDIERSGEAARRKVRRTSYRVTERELEWGKVANYRLYKSYVFISETGFNLYIETNFGRSIKVTPYKVTVPTDKGIAIILGTISEEEIYIVAKLIGCFRTKR
jgi:hypothetical protein